MKNLILFLLVAIVLVSCADVTNVDECTNAAKAYGFWSGLWHGWIAPWAFIGSLIWDDIAVFALNNNGNWYTFGFLLGAGTFYGGTRIIIRIPPRKRNYIKPIKLR